MQIHSASGAPVSVSIDGLKIEVGETWGSVVPIERASPDYRLSRIFTTKNNVVRLSCGHLDVIRGKIALFPPETPVRRSPGGGYTQFGICYFSRKRVEPMLGPDSRWDDSFEACTNIKSPSLDKIARRMIAEVISPGLASEILIDALGHVATVELRRYFDHRYRSDTWRVGGLTSRQMRQLVDYIEDRMGASISVADLANVCGLSSGHLRRAFKQATGRTLYNYVEEVRLNHAKSLLAATDMPINLLGRKLGFSDAAGFSSAFRRVAGETPSEFRRRSVSD